MSQPPNGSAQQPRRQWNFEGAPATPGAPGAPAAPATPGAPAAPAAPATTAESPWPVRVVAKKIADWIARLGTVWVEGEIAQLSRRPGTQTSFLTLRDPAADVSLSVTVRRDLLERLGPGLREGARVVLLAKPDYYFGRGTLSLRAFEIRAVGVGELLARLERIKQLLAAEGLFDPKRKRALPFLPRKVGLITGRASAAERDVRENAARRWPVVRFAVENCAVQGPGAAAAVIECLRALDRDPEVEVIVIARGGGSVEDLLPFSDETLCRAVAACRTPVVSAIGHEPDSPLLDYVADVRCSTPTDAGKRVVPDVADEQAKVEAGVRRMRRGLMVRLDREQTGLRTLRDRSRRVLTHRLDAANSDLTHTVARVRALSPAATLARGYAVVRRADGGVLRSPAEVAPGDRLDLRVAGGGLDVVVDTIRPDDVGGPGEPGEPDDQGDTTRPAEAS